MTEMLWPLTDVVHAQFSQVGLVHKLLLELLPQLVLKHAETELLMELENFVTIKTL